MNKRKANGGNEIILLRRISRNSDAADTGEKTRKTRGDCPRV